MVTRGNIPIDRGWAWMIVFSCFLLHILCVGAPKSFGVLFVELQRQFGASAGTVALITSLNAFFGMCSAPLATALGMKFTNRAVIIIGGIFMAVGYCLSATANDLPILYVSYGLLLGIGLGLCYAPGVVMVSQYFERRIALANGLSVAGSGVGSFIIPPMMRLLLDNYGLHGAMIILGALTLNLCLCGALMRPVNYYMSKTPEQKIEQNGKDKIDVDERSEALSNRKAAMADVSDQLADVDEVDAKYKLVQSDCDGGETRTRRRSGLSKASGLQSSVGDLAHASSLSIPKLLHSMDAHNTLQLDNEEESKSGCIQCTGFSMLDTSLLSNPLFLLYTLSVMFSSSGYMGIILFLAPQANSLSITENQQAAMLSVAGLTDLIGRVAFGWFSDLNLIKKKYGYMMAMMISGIICLFFPHFQHFTGQIILSGMFGFVGGSYIALIPVVYVEALGIERLPSAFGLSVFAQGISILVSNPLLGFLADRLGSWQVPFYLCGFSAMLGAACILLEPLAHRKMLKRDAAAANDDDADEGEAV